MHLDHTGRVLQSQVGGSTFLVGGCPSPGRCFSCDAVGCGGPESSTTVVVGAAETAQQSLPTIADTKVFIQSPVPTLLTQASPIQPPFPPCPCNFSRVSRLCSKAVRLRAGAAPFAAAARRAGDLAGVLVNSSLRTEGQRHLMQVCVRFAEVCWCRKVLSLVVAVESIGLRHFSHRCYRVGSRPPRVL